MTACVCFLIVCVCVYVCMLPFMNVTICGINVSYLKGAAPLQAVRCNTAYFFKLFLPPGGNCNVFLLNFKWRCDWCD